MRPGNTKAIEEMFDSISSKYDFLNDIFSFGLHRFWKRRLLDILNPISGEKWIDICCGTGDMSILLARYMKSSENIIGIDSASQALLVARERSKQNYSSIEWINGDALETNLKSHQFDGLLMVYGLRNLSSPYAGLREALRILKPGGRAGILDFRSFEGPSIQGLFQKIYLSFYVVPIASLFGLGKEYSYIKKSLLNFPSGEKQIYLALSAGFKKAKYQTLAKGQMGILLLEA
ncbi:bifunctional demethylmenaquinone methyltransferase/2-methoxy-6-polyprenyl-1,4-benzoquinol methylase UbiE [Prochlorococcus marinus]|uniref:2-phytyl-1,4-naphtoquinone methyltransferase n=1 Tax=Prochlorococcus marinus XMU1408 TaxID=2213228 RepID=A0A318QZQ5_PROMR|nr:bifunctional demethylmenaquinone methyltransferase/2-methoxy-6-polyprenyl-1,4-benzoquinol methylase UbiE [Prochlorococcus marinus]MBW3041455.1 bifunctional demethylmenaquinone methyltransferase/2-methoxy-6-polyprenyl-1,4-benzoquinol methylase UbiE [Prochlorococcus marinus str. XMU1408]PYE02616.1 bifunctional demethylmenaquinone methyltransferase/2-methoxy-6-polyprenyl-1,4-benzoquinol methylase UbiE [Prochlorococcus marinus XMU1408]